MLDNFSGPPYFTIPYCLYELNLIKPTHLYFSDSQDRYRPRPLNSVPTHRLHSNCIHIIIISRINPPPPKKNIPKDFTRLKGCKVQSCRFNGQTRDFESTIRSKFEKKPEVVGGITNSYDCCRWSSYKTSEKLFKISYDCYVYCTKGWPKATRLEELSGSRYGRLFVFPLVFKLTLTSQVFMDSASFKSRLTWDG